jgi:release factor glutamine methyltransferase
MPKTISEALIFGRFLLAHTESAEIIVPLLLAEVVQMSKEFIWAHPETTLDDNQWAHYEKLLHRTALGEPVAYILGRREFYGITFSVTPDVLIPRPETEALVDLARAHLGTLQNNSPVIVDVGTGSGCVAITLARLFPDARVYGIDISPKALAVARKNAELLRADVAFLEGSLLHPLAGVIDEHSVDALIANLPYISDSEYTLLPHTVKDFEPSLALRSGTSADNLNNALVSQAAQWLSIGALFAYETTHGTIQRVS